MGEEREDRRKTGTHGADRQTDRQLISLTKGQTDTRRRADRPTASAGKKEKRQKEKKKPVAQSNSLVWSEAKSVRREREKRGRRRVIFCVWLQTNVPIVLYREIKRWGKAGTNVSHNSSAGFLGLFPFFPGWLWQRKAPKPDISWLLPKERKDLEIRLQTLTAFARDVWRCIPPNSTMVQCLESMGSWVPIPPIWLAILAAKITARAPKSLREQVVLAVSVNVIEAANPWPIAAAAAASCSSLQAFFLVCKLFCRLNKVGQDRSWNANSKVKWEKRRRRKRKRYNDNLPAVVLSCRCQLPAWLFGRLTDPLNKKVKKGRRWKRRSASLNMRPV